jgi:V/A-type H+-transporting ATPase subunit A
MMSAGTLTRVVGALAEATGLAHIALNELVRIGDRQLLGEVLRVTGDVATVQVFEDTTGLRVGEPVLPLGLPLTIELGPGLLGSVIDGIGRPLARLADLTGDFIRAGATTATLDRTRVFSFTPTCTVGDQIDSGDVLGTIEDRGEFALKVLMPPGRSGVVRAVRAGGITVRDAIVTLDSGEPITAMQTWPVRRPRPAALRVEGTRPFLTGQRILDFLFPIAEGGTVALPGGFGTGKTVLEQTLAKYGDADIVVYIGCGERGNEMADVLHDFSTLADSRSGRLLLDRTVLVVNTSNMPVAARESSVYVGLTIAEYFRDMGYRVAVMADSLSRWAEALREVSSRLQEMPGEEGYPTSLASRTAKLHERAGHMRCLGRPERHGSVTLISAVSPPGGDFSEPVTQACLYVAGALWALDPSLAHQRQFPAVDWETSYSLYVDAMTRYFDSSVDPRWSATRARVLDLLQRDAELREVASVVGPEALEDRDRLLLATAATLREFVLGQNAFDPNDASSPPSRTFVVADTTVRAFDAGVEALASGVSFTDISFDRLRAALARLRDGAPPESESARSSANTAAGLITPTERPTGRIEGHP